MRLNLKICCVFTYFFNKTVFALFTGTFATSLGAAGKQILFYFIFFFKLKFENNKEAQLSSYVVYHTRIFVTQVFSKYY